MQKNSKKIALFTCHRDPNYGSMLQAYALVEAIRKLGRDSEYIDYYTSCEPPKGIKGLVLKLKKSIASFLKIHTVKIYKNEIKSEFYFFKEAWFASTIKSYELFHQQYIPCSAKKFFFDTIRQTFNVSEYDNYIVGSDQLWSPNLYTPQKPYFLDFADLPRKNSYATSLGTTVLTLDYLHLLQEKLSSFEHLSCREATNCNSLTKALGREVQHVLDPTLLLDSTEWDKIVVDPLIKGKYVLAYILGEKEGVIDFANKLGANENLPVYYIVTRPRYRNMEHSILGIGPDAFVGLIKHASYVVTDSFHGSLFSIIYGISFYSFSKRDGDLNNVDNIRIIEFLTMLNLQNRFQHDSDARFLDDINYEDVKHKLSLYKENSYCYLKSCL